MEQEVLTNEEEEKRIRRWVYTGIAVISVFVILLIWGIISALFPGEEKKVETETPANVVHEEKIPLPVQNLENPKEPELTEKDYFDKKNLHLLNAPQFPEASSLELSKQPVIRRK